jgi:hypothetical protein
VAGGDEAALDRDCDGTISPADTALAANSVTPIAVPSELSQVKAFLVNLTMVNGLTPGYITAERCQDVSAGPQSKSSGNFGVSTAIANLGVVRNGGFGGFWTREWRRPSVPSQVASPAWTRASTPAPTPSW